jgi:hypothetical protein
MALVVHIKHLTRKIHEFFALRADKAQFIDNQVHMWNLEFCIVSTLAQI